MERMSVRIDNVIFTIVLTLTFLGFYAAMIAALNAGLSGDTRLIAIPFRIVIGFCCGMLYLRNYKNRSPILIWFIIFSLIYGTRVFLDYVSLKELYIPYYELVFYYISFALIPFVGISKARVNSHLLKKVYSAFIVAGFLFSILATLSYRTFIGEFGRISARTTGEAVISPLILSYCGVLILGVVSMNLLLNTRSKKRRVIELGLLGVSIIPFFLGASRGSLFALFLPFIMVLFSRFDIKVLIRTIIFTVLSVLLLIYFDNILNSGLLERFMGTSKAIEQGTGSAIRLDIWKTSLGQFFDNPLFGDKLNTDVYNNYPHNIFIEVLQTTGLFGFLPFIYIVFKAFKVCLRVFKSSPEYGWVCVFFLQAVMQNMFSGALYTAAWFWSSMALMFGLNEFIKRERLTNNRKSNEREKALPT